MALITISYQSAHIVHTASPQLWEECLDRQIDTISQKIANRIFSNFVTECSKYNDPFVKIPTFTHAKIYDVSFKYPRLSLDAFIDVEENPAVKFWMHFREMNPHTEELSFERGQTQFRKIGMEVKKILSVKIAEIVKQQPNFQCKVIWNNNDAIYPDNHLLLNYYFTFPKKVEDCIIM